MPNPNFGTDAESLGPGFPPVDAPIDPAVVARHGQNAGSGGDHQVFVIGIDERRRKYIGALESDLRPTVSRIGGPVHPVASVPTANFARPGVNDVWIGLRDRDRTDRTLVF